MAEGIPAAGTEVHERCSERLERILQERGYANFHEVREEYVCTLYLVNLSPLHVGSKGENRLGSPVDLSVVISTAAEVAGDGELRVYEGPVIPGSSLKGVFRSILESIAVAQGLMEFELAAPDGTRLRCTGEALAEVESWLSRAHCSDENIIFVENNLKKCFASPVVMLFGAPWIASHVKVFDAYPADMALPPRRIVTHVSIDRLTGSQSPRRLYKVEVVEAGVVWKITIRVQNIDLLGGSWPARLFRELLRVLDEGIGVGGKTSIGHGRLKLLRQRSSCTRIYFDREAGSFKREEIPLEKLLSMQD